MKINIKKILLIIILFAIANLIIIYRISNKRDNFNKEYHKMNFDCYYSGKVTYIKIDRGMYIEIDHNGIQKFRVSGRNEKLDISIADFLKVGDFINKPQYSDSLFVKRSDSITGFKIN